QAPQYTPPQAPPAYNSDAYTSNKSKTTAGILAILIGGLGIHKFYLGRIGWGILYILFCWTYIPAIAGVIEGIIYLTSSEEKFYYKYVKK
ncbi:MAG: TM2 domain-containing protein, partial [Clostridia bacterium]